MTTLIEPTIKVCDNELHHLCGSSYLKNEVPFEFYFKNSKKFSGREFSRCIWCRKYKKTDADTNSKDETLIKIDTETNPLIKKCNDRSHQLHCRFYYKNDVPIKYFYKDPENISGREYVTCLWCREYDYKRKVEKKKKNLLSINIDHKLIIEKESNDSIINCSIINSSIISSSIINSLTANQPVINIGLTGSVKICAFRDHHLRCKVYNKNEVPINFFYKDPKYIIGKEYKRCSWCRTPAVVTVIPNQLFKICNSPTHYLRCDLYDKNEVPIKFFYQNDSDRLLDYCFWCREYITKMQDDKINKSLSLTENFKSQGLDVKCCNAKTHTDKISVFPREQVPIENFRRDPENPNSILLDMCIDCRKYSIIVTNEIRYINKLKMETMEDIENVFQCNGCFKIKNINEKYVKKNGDLSIRCTDCKFRSKKQYDKRTKLFYDIRLELIIKNSSCCELCHVIFIKGPNNGLPLIILNTRLINDIRYVIYEDNEYIAVDFIKRFVDIIELDILDFDHLTEEEQREKGLLSSNEPFIGKKCNVNRCTSEFDMRNEIRKCQLICKKCHVKETIKRERGYVMHKQRLERFTLTNSIKSKGCELCGYINIKLPRFFDFDHLNPKTKLYNISKMIADSDVTMEQLYAEIDKCRVLCRNCHFIHTRNQIKEGINFYDKQLL